MMHYIKTGDDNRVMAVFDPPEIPEEWTDEEKQAAMAYYDGMIQMDLPEDFDWEHIDRYGVNDDGTLTDYGYEPPPEPEDPDYPGRIETLENCMTALMEGINDA